MWKLPTKELYNNEHGPMGDKQGRPVSTHPSSCRRTAVSDAAAYKPNHLGSRPTLPQMSHKSLGTFSIMAHSCFVKEEKIKFNITDLLENLTGVTYLKHFACRKAQGKCGLPAEKTAGFVSESDIQ